MSPNGADWLGGPAHRQAAEAPVFPGRGFSASAACEGRPGRYLAHCAVHFKMMCTNPVTKELEMALDRDAQRVLEMVPLSGRPPYETLSPTEARALFLVARTVLAPDPPPTPAFGCGSTAGSQR